METEEDTKAWTDLFTELELVFHVSNMVLERFDYDTAMKYKDLKEAIICNNKHLAGDKIGLHASHWPSIGVHANQNTDDDHTDDKSSFLGYDNILPFGDFHEGWLLFPSLGIRIRVFPGDIILIRGAALRHRAWKWRGKGRFVVVPFADRHLFPTERVGRICQPSRLYRSQYKEARGQSLAQPLPTFDI
jgi:hypothetical protein